MGCEKNKKSPNAYRGKYRKKRVPAPTNPPETSLNISTANRIVSLSYLEKHLQTMTAHAATCQACNENATQGKELFHFLHETSRAGLASTFTSHCAGCQQEFTFSTSDKVKGISGGLHWEVNLAVV